MKENRIASFVPTYAVIAKVIVAVIAIVVIASQIVAACANKNIGPLDALRLMGGGAGVWKMFLALSAVWLFGDIISDIVWRWGNLAPRPTAGFVNAIQSLGGVFIVVVTTIAAIGLWSVGALIVGIVVFVFAMAATMTGQVVLANYGMAGNTIHDGLLNYAQQLIVMGVTFFGIIRG